MSTQSSPGRRRYGLLRATGSAMYAMYLASAVLVVLVGVMAVMMSLYWAPSWLDAIVIVGALLLGAISVIIGLTVKKLSAALSDAGSNLEQIRTDLYQKASDMNR